MSNVSLVSYNITLKKVGLNANTIQLDKIKGIVTDHTSETGLIVSQFPNMVVIAAPKKQVTVIVREEDIIINDSSTEIADDKATVVCAIAHDINNAIPESLARYRFNYDFVFEFSSPAVASNFVTYFNAPLLTAAKLVADAANLTFASFTIGEKIGDTAVRTGINPMLDKDDAVTKQIGVQRSVIFHSQKLAAISELKTTLISNHATCVQLHTDIQNTVQEEA